MHIHAQSKAEPSAVQQSAVAPRPETSDFEAPILSALVILKQAREAVRTQKETRAERFFKDGTKLMTSEEYSRAITKLKLSVRLWPDLAEAHSNLGYCYRKQKLYGKAISAYLEAIRLKPDLVEAREYLAEAYAELAALYREKAREELEVLKTLDQEEADAVEMLMRKLDL